MMETLDGTEWDVVILGTGFAESLLALSLSRSGKRILHLDKNDYYGGDEAALSLSEAEAWASRFAEDAPQCRFSKASVTKPAASEAEHGNQLSSSRAYSLALAPHIIYARSNLVPALVSSRSHSQLDFQAVGSWFVVGSSADSSQVQQRLIRVPSGREDVFQDKSFDLKAKRSLMKFLRFVAAYEDQPDVWEGSRQLPFSIFLEQKFGLPASSHEPILALTMSQASAGSTSTEHALPSIARHLRSLGIFGPGFGAVLPKWGGLAEIAQVACRACAVGGGVYVLNKSIKSMTPAHDDSGPSLELSDGEKLSTTWLCGSVDDSSALRLGTNATPSSAYSTSRSISIVSSPLPSLFPPTSEGGVAPAGAVVVVPSSDASEPPVHMFVHTSDAGECPMNQSVIYSSIAMPHDSGLPHLERAVASLLGAVREQPSPQVLWSLRYQQQHADFEHSLMNAQEGVIVLSSLSCDLVLEDSSLDKVKIAWQKITGESENAFMNFDPREGANDEDD
ncbi:Rab proteins geranylgeranyltransferase component A [Vermiconidia calcicola]|uniref:Rab proteins geranylgeranyltransferase component A n=1 Tax=Vermiconidia calcicola TaxID=1690605 RepID=A0ACC3NUM4_9PEZI|nr:Rab proteins geranylgeranyltransferase component A [Vermiconidia calcicola]